MDNVIRLSNNQGQEESGWKSSKLYATELISEGVLLCSAKKLNMCLKSLCFSQ